MSLFTKAAGPLGHGSLVTCTTPVKIRAFEGKFIEKISCGNMFNTAVDSEGNVYNWGEGFYGVFGDGKDSNYSLPKLNQYFTYLKDEEKKSIVEIKSSNDYSIGLFNDGKLYGWGNNVQGQLGIDVSFVQSRGLHN